MYFNKRNKKGFTLIELVMIIVILGILAAVAVPQFFDLSSDAKAAAEKGVVGAVRSGIMTYYAKNQAYPSSLDSVTAPQACDTANACFTTILAQGGVTADWTKTGTLVYQGPTGTTYTYDSANGTFQ